MSEKDIPTMITHLNKVPPKLAHGHKMSLFRTEA